MKTTFTLLTFCCVLASTACKKQPADSDVYNPVRAPLTADEVAALLDLHHWKITQTPDDGKPYWGVRVVVANRGFAAVGDDPPYQMIYHTGLLRFDSPVDSKADPRILLGLQIGPERITGQINATSPDSTYTTRFQIPGSIYQPDQKGGGNRICSGARWKDNRVDLIEFQDSTGRTIRVVCLEFLHADPGG